MLMEKGWTIKLVDGSEGVVAQGGRGRIIVIVDSLLVRANAAECEVVSRNKVGLIYKKGVVIR